MDQNNEEKNKKKKGALDYANQGYNAYNNARKAQGVLRAIKTARTAQAVVSTAAATSEIWVPLFIILFLVLIFVMLFFIIIGGPPQVNGGIGEIILAPGQEATPSAGLCTDIPNQTCEGTRACGDDGLFPGIGTCNIANTACCTRFKFLCQYGGVNSEGHLVSRRLWNRNACDIERGGCGPTSIAMITNTFGKNYTPTEIAIANGRNGCSGSNGVSAPDVINLFAPWLRNRGFKVTGNLASGGNIPLSTVKNFIDNGYLILGGAYVRWVVNPFPGQITRGFTNNFEAHAFVVTNVNVGNASVTASDPTFCEAGHYGGGRTLTNANGYGSSIQSVRGWLFAFAIKPN